MSVKLKFLKKVIFILVLLGFILPIKAPVSSAKAKMCCMSKGHCMMGKQSEAKISVMGASESAKMISCCQDNCVSCLDSSILHPRSDLASQNMEMSPTSGPIISIAMNHSFFTTGPPHLRQPDFRLITGIHSPPIFQLNSAFLI